MKVEARAQAKAEANQSTDNPETRFSAKEKHAHMLVGENSDNFPSVRSNEQLTNALKRAADAKQSREKLQNLGMLHVRQLRNKRQANQAMSVPDRYNVSSKS